MADGVSINIYQYKIQKSSDIFRGGGRGVGDGLYSRRHCQKGSELLAGINLDGIYKNCSFDIPFNFCKINGAVS